MNCSGPDHGVPLSQAARQLGCSVATVQRMIRRGAPCIRPGEVGRNKGALIDLDALAAWLAPEVAQIRNERILDLIGESLWNALKRDLAHDRAGVSEQQAAAVLVVAFGRVYQDLTHRSLDELDVRGQMRHVCNISVPWKA